MQKRKIPIHRLISTVMGSTLLDDAELRDFAQMAAEAKLEVIITPGPRSGWDVGRQLATPEGALSGLRYRGSDQLSYVVAEILRCIDIGFRGLLCVDEGLLWVLNQLKKTGDIPEDVVFKVSIFAGHASAAGGKVLQMLGASTFNPLGDLSLPQLASIRQAIDIPMVTCIFTSQIPSVGSTGSTKGQRWRGSVRPVTSRLSQAQRWPPEPAQCIARGRAPISWPGRPVRRSSTPRLSTS